MERSPLEGKMVICRCTAAGVHAGTLISQKGQVVHLNNAIRLWYWKARKMKFLNGVALHGLDPASKIGAPIPEVVLTEVCEILGCSNEAAENLSNFKPEAL